VVIRNFFKDGKLNFIIIKRKYLGNFFHGGDFGVPNPKKYIFTGIYIWDLFEINTFETCCGATGTSPLFWAAWQKNWRVPGSMNTHLSHDNFSVVDPELFNLDPDPTFQVFS
jgi:hypothetical protein